MTFCRVAYELTNTAAVQPAHTTDIQLTNFTDNNVKLTNATDTHVHQTRHCKTCVVGPNVITEITPAHTPIVMSVF